MTIEPLLTRDQAAEVIGMSIGTIKSAIRRKEIAVIRIGSAVRIEPDELRRWIASQRDGTVGEFVGTPEGNGRNGPDRDDRQVTDMTEVFLR